MTYKKSVPIEDFQPILNYITNTGKVDFVIPQEVDIGQATGETIILREYTSVKPGAKKQHFTGREVSAIIYGKKTETSDLIKVGKCALYINILSWNCDLPTSGQEVLA